MDRLNLNVRKLDLRKEALTAERCWILESQNTPEDPAVSIARARVERGITTAWHAVEGTIERYVIVEGRGRVEVGDVPPTEVWPGDVVLIPAGVRQRIANIGACDLIFYCVCTPRFEQRNYRELE
jgi:mannose-6-phosphate isomerase-like protein (cupin superfamily)